MNKEISLVNFTTMQGHARCTHVQVASATFGYITRTVATQLATKHRHHCPPLQWLPPPVPIQTLAHEAKVHRVDTWFANAKLSKVEQNTHMAMQLRCRACPNIADNPPLPQPCKEVLRDWFLSLFRVNGCTCWFRFWLGFGLCLQLWNTRGRVGTRTRAGSCRLKGRRHETGTRPLACTFCCLC